MATDSKTMGLIFGFIGAAIIGGVLLTLNQAAVGGALPWLVLGFVPVIYAASLLKKAAGAGGR